MSERKRRPNRHRKHRGYDKYHSDPQKATIHNYCAVDSCDMPAGFRLAKTKLCCRYRPCEKYQPININQL